MDWLEDRKKGVDENAPHIVRGNLLEPALAEWFADETGFAVEGDGETVEIGEQEWIRCSPDRWVTDTMTGEMHFAEIKTSKVSAGWGPDGATAKRRTTRARS